MGDTCIQNCVPWQKLNKWANFGARGGCRQEALDDFVLMRAGMHCARLPTRAVLSGETVWGYNKQPAAWFLLVVVSSGSKELFGDITQRSIPRPIRRRWSRWNASCWRRHRRRPRGGIPLSGPAVDQQRTAFKMVQHAPEGGRKNEIGNRAETSNTQAAYFMSSTHTENAFSHAQRPLHDINILDFIGAGGRHGILTISSCNISYGQSPLQPDGYQPSLNISRLLWFGSNIFETKDFPDAREPGIPKCSFFSPRNCVSLPCTRWPGLRAHQRTPCWPGSPGSPAGPRGWVLRSWNVDDRGRKNDQRVTTTCVLPAPVLTKTHERAPSHFQRRTGIRRCSESAQHSMSIRSFHRRGPLRYVSTVGLVGETRSDSATFARDDSATAQDRRNKSDLPPAACEPVYVLLSSWKRETCATVPEELTPVTLAILDRTALSSAPSFAAREGIANWRDDVAEGGHEWQKGVWGVIPEWSWTWKATS